MIGYKDLTDIIKNSNMSLINRYSSTYISGKLSNLSYEDLVNNRNVSVEKINNKNVGEDSYTIKVFENKIEISSNLETNTSSVLPDSRFSLYDIGHR